MSHIPYVSAIGNLMYVMVYTRMCIANAMEFLTKYMFGALDSSKEGFQVSAWH